MYEKHAHIIHPVFCDLQTMERIENVKIKFGSNWDLVNLVNAIEEVHFSMVATGEDLGMNGGDEAIMQF